MEIHILVLYNVTVVTKVSEELNLIFLNSHSGGWSRTGSTLHVGHWMAYCTCPWWLWWWRILWNEDWQGKPKYSEKTCPSDTLSTTFPNWPDQGSNPGRRCGKPATNRLSYGAVYSEEYSVYIFKVEEENGIYKAYYLQYYIQVPYYNMCMILR
jgi:hypothetical protein